jgi:transposase
MSLSHQNIFFSDEHKENIRKSLQDVEKITIDIDKLKNLLELGYSQRKIAKEFECSPKTIRRRVLKHNLI